MILIIEHIDIEGPGTIETYCKSKKIPFKTIALHKNDPLPKDLSNLEAVIVMGGPMNVYEEDKFPFLKQEDVFIKQVLKEQIPYLGVCLGSQLLARACGAKVVKSPVKEVGWFSVDLSKEGKTDPLFANLKNTFDVYHWHEDMWELPKNADLLATATGCPHQAFKVGKNAYGLQFHIEVTEKIIKDWCESYFKSGDVKKKKKAQGMLATYQRKKNSFLAQSEVVYDNFREIIRLR